jgi:hypothetical protein
MDDQNLLSGVPPCFVRHVKPSVPAAFAVDSTLLSVLDPHVELWHVPLCIIHKIGLCPRSGNINRLMMMMLKKDC